MYIIEYMTPEPITVSPEMLLPEARAILNAFHFRHLPVVDGSKKILGIITDRDLRSAYPSTLLTDDKKQLVYEQVEKTTVAEVMTSPCISLHPGATLDDALLLIDRDRIGAMPVVDAQERVIGMFSVSDLTAAYKTLFGVTEKGSVLIALEDDGQQANSMSRILTLLEKHEIACTRIIRMPAEGTVSKIYLRINTFRLVAVHKLLQNAGFILLKP